MAIFFFIFLQREDLSKLTLKKAYKFNYSLNRRARCPDATRIGSRGPWQCFKKVFRPSPLKIELPSPPIWVFKRFCIFKKQPELRIGHFR